MTKSLIIVFVKNIKLGTVKTRLAKTIGDYGAFEVYSELVKITENATEDIYTLDLAHGSLLVMGKGCQENYMHSLLKDPKYKLPRINITFREASFS